MTETSATLNWSVERRLEFIEFRLQWEGRVNRSDIIDAFDVSTPQSSKDLTLYNERAPGNAEYDRVAKRYIAGARFAPLFAKSDPSDYLDRLLSYAQDPSGSTETWLGYRPEVDAVPTPEREVDPAVLRNVLAAVRDGRSIEILYQSMSADRPEPIRRRITPHAFAHDGFRWHARAFCHRTDAFRDFLLPRILDAGDTGEPGAAKGDDQAWRRRFSLEIVPHPELEQAQQAIVMKDYRMVDGFTAISVRCAMLFYTLKHLNLLNDPETRPARQQHIVIRNKEETMEALRTADWAI